MKPTREANSNSVYLDRPFGEGAVASRPNDSVPDAIAKIEKAWAVVVGLSDGSRRWIMSIPADVDNDPDLVIADALATARRVLEAGMQLPNNQQNLICKSCGVDRSKEDCKGDRLRCGLASIAYSDHVAVISAEPESRVEGAREFNISRCSGFVPMDVDGVFLQNYCKWCGWHKRHQIHVTGVRESKYGMSQPNTEPMPNFCLLLDELILSWNTGPVPETQAIRDRRINARLVLENAIAVLQSGISSPTCRPNEQDVVREGK